MLFFQHDKIVFMHAVVLGTGSWGTALALLLARNGHDVTLAGRNEDTVECIQKRRENMQYLPGYALAESVKAVHFSQLPSKADLWVIAVPSTSLPQVVQYLPKDAEQVLIATKGLVDHGNFLLGSLISEQLPLAKLAVISGPNLAHEIVQGIPSVAVIASSDNDYSTCLASFFRSYHFRIYTSSDIAGVEIAGALKNPLALAAGISDGIGYGDNTKGALLARGLHEMTKIGLALGARIETFIGIAGVGDLFATAHSKLSRNYRVGYAIGQGLTLPQALREINQIAEGGSDL
jgi:glycerol-3-phosphate dehydrogenase (NAD(P)+)